MNLASAGLPNSAWYGLGRSTTSNWSDSVLQFERVPNVTSSQILPIGAHDTPWLEHVRSDSQLHHAISVEYVDAAPVVHQYLGELYINLVVDGRINNQSIPSWVWHDLGVILSA